MGYYEVKNGNKVRSIGISVPPLDPFGSIVKNPIRFLGLLFFVLPSVQHSEKQKSLIAVAIRLLIHL
jgi:hypothetical protein